MSAKRIAVGAILVASGFGAAVAVDIYIDHKNELDIRRQAQLMLKARIQRAHLIELLELYAEDDS